MSIRGRRPSDSFETRKFKESSDEEEVTCDSPAKHNGLLRGMSLIKIDDEFLISKNHNNEKLDVAAVTAEIKNRLERNSIVSLTFTKPVHSGRVSHQMHL